MWRICYELSRDLCGRLKDVLYECIAALDRLEAYEATGLDPEQIKNMMEGRKDGDS